MSDKHQLMKKIAGMRAQQLEIHQQLTFLYNLNLSLCDRLGDPGSLEPFIEKILFFLKTINESIAAVIEEINQISELPRSVAAPSEIEQVALVPAHTK